LECRADEQLRLRREIFPRSLYVPESRTIFARLTSQDIVDLSPSLCEMARKRFARLGWKNVKVICQDARAFRLHEHEPHAYERKEHKVQGQTVRDLDENADAGGAELVTMSYALSMIPEFYPVIDSIDSLLSPHGVAGVVDFYVQNQVDFRGRNYIGGAIDRHCMWLSRVFWRTWFEIDRVNLEAARRVSVRMRREWK
jgi:betaine lipid synthase